jgi:hypothetical protein
MLVIGTTNEGPGLLMSLKEFKTLAGFASVPGNAILNVMNLGGVDAHYKLVFHDVA